MTDRLSAASAAMDQPFAALKREVLAHVNLTDRLARTIVRLAGIADASRMTTQDWADIQEAANIADQSGPINEPVPIFWPGTDKPILPTNVVQLRSPQGAAQRGTE